MGTKKGQVRKTARRAYKGKRKKISRADSYLKEMDIIKQFYALKKKKK